MRRAVDLFVALLAAPFVVGQPAAARECGTWDASMQELEEGRAMVASVCSNDDGGRSFLEARCFPPGLNIRYVPVVDGDFNNLQRDLVFVTDDKQRPVFVTYEGLDGAFSAYLPLGHTALEMLKSGKTVTVRDPEGKVPSRTFALGGSRKAFDKLEKSCGR